MSTPSFAFIGAVSHGKSSIAATLVEDGRIGVGQMPGTTKKSQCFDWLGGNLRVWDTPGFQSPREMLDEIREPARTSPFPLDVFRHFASHHATGGHFAAERELLQPLFEGAAILYVIDTSRRLMKAHIAEMEILSLTGLPRLAILNPTGPAEHEQEWRAKLGQQFGAVHEFNAHRAGVAQRAALLRTMATVADEWRDSLIKVAADVEADWSSRLQHAAQVIMELIERSITHVKRKTVAPGEEKRPAVESMKKAFQDDLCRIEMEAHVQLCKLFRHELVAIEARNGLPIGHDLFSQETWKVFGLPWQAIMGAGATAGAAIGAKVGLTGEAATPSGIPTAIGASVGLVVGGAAAIYGGKSVAQPSVKEEVDSTTVGSLFSRVGRTLGGRITHTGTRLTVGPLTNEDFPYVLLDRASVIVWYLASRAHAIRDEYRADPGSLKAALDRIEASTEHWPQDLRKAGQRYFRSVRKRVLARETASSFRDLLASHMESFIEQPFVPCPQDF